MTNSPNGPGQPANQYMAQQQPAKQKSGAGKAFVFGFLGALLACAIAFGGFAVWQSHLGSGKANAGAAATTVLGTSNQSVIEAVDQGQTLPEAVAAKTLPSVVAIYNYQQQTNSGYGFGYGYGVGSGSGSSTELVAAGMGSGVVITDDGYIITNYHVVEGADKLTVTVDGVERDAEFVGSDSSSDIAVIKVDDTTGLVAAEIGDSDDLKIGEWVMTIGAPLGLEQSVATGVVSATNRSTILDLNASGDAYSYYYGTTVPNYAYYPNMIQTDALINPGNSGGALVDADGKLIGINSMLSSYSGDYAGVGFAIPINYAMGIATDIMAGKEPTHAALGVSISQVNNQTAQRMGLSSATGAYVASIYAGTGAADSDLQVGDIITAINGKPIASTTDVTLDVRGYAVGDTVTVTVNRSGESIDIPVTLTSDENIVAQTEESAQQWQQQQLPEGYGDGRGGWGSQGGTDDLSEEEIELLMRLFGM
ncbi:MAG: trypsin-like peptidase domain-containing protein [Eggerthellaceae bacterium]|nr:trypsin-like peptidase domain-containing protein [Eggerthellaceae bacterium]